MENKSNILGLILFLIFFERIDFSLGASPVRVTPLIISIILMQIYMVIQFFTKNIKLNKNFLYFVLIFFIIALLSFFANQEIPNIGKFITMVFNIILAYQIYLFSSDNVIDIISKSLKKYIIFCIPLLIYDYCNYFLGLNYYLTFIDLTTFRLWEYAPRFSGYALDPNRGGFEFVLIYAFFRYIRTNSIYVTLSFLMMILSISRSAIISILILEIYMMCLYNDNIFAKIKKIICYFSIVIFTVIFILAYQDVLNIIIAIVISRISLDEYSAASHIELFEIALKYIFHNVFNFLVGYGPGSSANLLKGYFDSVHGNFHSGYLTIWIEYGSICFGAIFISCFYYLIKKNNPILAIFLIFSISYQYFSPFVYIMIVVWSKNFHVAKKDPLLSLSSINMIEGKKDK